MRTVGKLRGQLVLARWQGDHGFALACTKVAVIVIKGHGLACCHWHPVDQQMVVSAVLDDVARRCHSHALDAETHLEGGAHRGAIGRLQQ